MVYYVQLRVESVHALRNAKSSRRPRSDKDNNDTNPRRLLDELRKNLP